MTVIAPNGKTVAEKVPPVRVASPRWRRPAVLALALIVAGVAVLAVLMVVRSKATTTYTAVPVVRQNLAQAVTASGTVNPQNTILVGTQVSGTIQTIYVDYNSRVREGEVLARLDPSQLQAELDQAQAMLAQARAQASTAQQSQAGANYSVSAAGATVSSAQAGASKARSDLTLAQITLHRDTLLLRNGYISQSQYDTDATNAIGSRQALSAAEADVAQTSAQTLQSRSGAIGSASSAQAAAAAVEAAQATVTQDDLNLERSVIVSPVNGTVVARNVSVGQTVAASFQTPTLFTIAQDLKKMEVDIAVGEPDIGNVRPRDPVHFSVLAYPNETFHGVVSQVRVNPTTVANVVTYDVVVLVDNNAGKLLPGMTANASIRVAQVRNALVVPVEALSYRPSSGSRTHRGGASITTASPWGQTGSGAPGAVVSGSRGLVFVTQDGKPRAIPVRVGLVSGMLAAVVPLRGTLTAGDAVITADSGGRAARTGSTTNSTPSLNRMIR